MLLMSFYLVISPAKGGTSITFWNIEMNMDDVDDYEGVRIVVFFLPGCGNCINEIDILKDIDNDYNVTIFELDADKESTNQTLIDFKNNHTIPDSWILGYSTDSSENYFHVSGVPTSVVLDDFGRIVAVIVGYTSYNTFETAIDDAINHRTENYNTDFSDPTEQLKALFIIIGVGVGVIVIYFLVKSFIKK